ncbi:hypothetical protein B0H15DRAFT_832864 [Mycena belliarum]|uniref:Uncharacterized protein n=1 Tax=Mycena belliarum TaxID=1033014 RepID=A0AAD6TXH1_9AGAR|nr:hypothetical protein B0H15DRAFT_861545 [Mycena belliae]KAJ7092883.1 hypothetical protein B0H15DRAFT_832864 [Mycena belliae]
MRFRLPEVTHRDLSKPLPTDAEDQAIQSARRDAIFAGMSAALVSAVIGSRFMGFGRVQMILSGAGSGALSGYFFNQAFVAANLAEIEKEKERLSALGIQAFDKPRPQD